MTKRRRHYLAGFMRSKRPQTITTYGVHVLDSTAAEIMPAGPSMSLRDQQLAKHNYRRRESEPSDPWLSPQKSLVVQECTWRIEQAMAHTLVVKPEESDFDLRGLCEDAELSKQQVDVIVLVGEGWSQREIASWLGVGQATVSRYLHSGRHKLAGWLPLEVAYKLATA